jgi:Na+:H+ antiporter, NhaA family
MNRMPAPTPTRPLTRRILQPIERFLRIEALSGIVLLAAAAAALIWANSPWAGSYEALWSAPLALRLGDFGWSQPLRFWVNDGLMTVFFLVVGLEIRREMHDGALSDPRIAILPVVAAGAGVIMPAILYLMLNMGPPLDRGWAIPTATDIAFAVGVLSLAGKRVPSALRMLLLTLAVIDDIVAILVIAFFYADGIGIGGLGIAAAGTVAGLVLRGAGSRWPILYVLPGVALWIGFLRAGVHPALAGVVLGLLMRGDSGRRVEHTISPWVVLAIMPLFAMVNAGVTLRELTLDLSTSARLVGGIVVALVVGKPLGIILTAAMSTKLGWCALPPGIDLRRFAVVGSLGGIGFTMSLFVCDLAFDSAYLATAKLAVLLGSTLAAIGGLMLGRSNLARPTL